MVTPREFPSVHSDPWQLGAEALRHWSLVGRSIKMSKSADVVASYEAVAELIRQLAYGPE